MAVTLYTRASCPFSARLRDELERRGARFAEVDVETRPERVPELVKLTGGRRIVPVLVDGATIAVAPQGGTDF